MSIRTILNKDIEARTETVTYKGTTYTLSGAPNINIIGDAMMAPEEVSKQKAAHYTTVTKSPEPFSPKMVMNVLMVSATLQHEDDPAKRYDETEIAGVAVRESGLFLKLMAAASKVLGIADGAVDADTVAAMGLGKSDCSAAPPTK